MNKSVVVAAVQTPDCHTLTVAHTCTTHTQNTDAYHKLWGSASSAPPPLVGKNSRIGRQLRREDRVHMKEQKQHNKSLLRSIMMHSTHTTGEWGVESRCTACIHRRRLPRCLNPLSDHMASGRFGPQRLFKHDVGSGKQMRLYSRIMSTQ